MTSFKLMITALCLSLFMVSCGSEGPVDTHPEKNLTVTDKTIISNNNDFGYDLFKLVDKTNIGKNVFISPLSVSMALGMTYNGAAGTTRDAFVNVLRLVGMDQTAINESYQNIDDILSKLDSKVQFSLANSIWYKSGWTFEQSFIDINKKYFGAEVNAIDFTSPDAPGVINNWVETNTNGRIKKILESIPDNMVMYLINTIYFKAPWKYKFDKEKTTADDFHSSDKIYISCSMMNNEGKFSHYSDESVIALSLPYGNGSFRMLLLMPRTENISDYITKLDNSLVSSIDKKLTQSDISVKIPKFKMEFESILNNFLKTMGLSDAFNSEAADFSNMYKGLEKLFITEVKHKSYVDVNEEGTEAAAATSVGIGNTAMPEIYTFNKPFVFLITDTRTNTVMFIGKLEIPQ